MKSESIERPDSGLQIPQTSLEKNELNEYRHKYLWHGFFTFFLGCIIPLFLPLYISPRAGLAAHNVAITSGTFFISLGVALPYIQLSRWSAKVMYWLLLLGAYFGLAGQYSAAVFGLKKSFIITGKGSPGNAEWMEIGVDIMLKVISSFTLLACVIILLGLRRVKFDSSSTPSQK